MRKRLIAATVITCIVLAFIGGTLHVVKLGSNRMMEMRSKASYDLSEEKQRIRAAGEEISRHRAHEEGQLNQGTYTVAEAEALLTEAQWQELQAMVLIPAGGFVMGTDREMANKQDQPRHRVFLPAYKIDKHPVTNAEYARFVAETGHRPPLNWDNGRIPPGKALHPVTMVSWFDAKAYAEWAGKRLPTEAEWEKAARGDDGRRWPWGNHMDPARLNTYYQIGDTTPVTRFEQGASPYGVLDMAGNVTEWTASDFLPYKGSDAPDKLFKVKVPVVDSAADRNMKVADIVTTNKGSYRVLRGGSWSSDPFATAAYHRNYQVPNKTSDFYGFRTVLDVEQSQTKGVAHNETHTE